MNALLFIQKKRQALERIDFVGAMRLAMNGSKRDVERAMEKWARSAEANLRFEE